MSNSIDNLISQLNLTDAPIAKWPLRHESHFLARLAEANAKWPDHFGEYAENALRFANWWTAEAREPIVGMKGMDRKGSFLGGFPWTSAEHPWPCDQNGEPLAPILQLNLTDFEREPLQIENAALFQIWADFETGIEFRSIPLIQTDTSPDSALLSWKGGSTYYRFEGFNDAAAWETPTDLNWFDGKVVGEYVRPSNDWQFSFGRNLADLPSQYQDDASIPYDIRETWTKLAKLSQKVPQIVDDLTDENSITSGIFGGQAYFTLDNYEEYSPYLNIYSPKEGGYLIDSDNFGLFNWFDSWCDGKLAVLWNPKDATDIIAVIA